MHIGIPRHTATGDCRVALSPAGVESLVAKKHRVIVQSGAGAESGFSDLDFGAGGADIVHSLEETIRRSRLILSIGAPAPGELGFLGPEHTWAGYLHLAVAPPTLLDELLENQVSLIDYETIQTPEGILPVQVPMSEIAGKMSVHVAATLLQNDRNGPGVLLSGVPGVPPADTVIIGGGVVGTNAARAFSGLGSQVTLLDANPRVLKRIDDEFHGRVVTMAAHKQNVRKAVAFADVLVGCVLKPGGRSPHVVTREMVRSMRRGSVVLDISIDQGGCVETSRPTTHRDPTFVEEEVIHYCVPNMPSAVGRTATHALTNAVLPFIHRLADAGLTEAARTDPALGNGINVYQGHLTNAQVAASLGCRHEPLGSLLVTETRGG